MKKLINDEKLFNRLVEWKYGYILYNHSAVNMAESIELYGEFSGGEVHLFKHFSRPGYYILDIGANIGVFTIPFSKFVGDTGKVFAFEVQKLFFQVLTANVALNSLKNVFTYNFAVSNKVDTIELLDQRVDIPLSNCQLSLLAPSNEDQKVKVKQIVLDEFYDEKRLDIMKIDVEGMEYEVIEGAKKLIEKFRPILYVENDRKEKSEALIELIQSLNYRLFWHAVPLYNKNNYANVEKNIFGRYGSINMLCIHKSINANIKGLREIHDAKDYYS